MDRLAWLVIPSRYQLLFALRMCTAIALALYLSMWLQLERPYWASLEVAAMIQPTPGQAAVRAFARAAGTLIAAGAGLTIVGLFYQSYELSVTALAAWVGFCAFGANLFRNNLSYGFAIACTITTMVVVLSHTTNQPPFDIAIMRTLECLLAASVTAAVNLLLSPPISLRNYLYGRLELLRSLGGELKRLAAYFQSGRTAGDTPETTADEAADQDPHPALQVLAAQTLALEQTRRYVRHESPEFVGFNRLARRLDYDILSLISATSALHIYLSSRARQVDTRPVSALAESAERLQAEPDNPEAVKVCLDAAYGRILAMGRESADHGRSRRLADWVVLSRTLGLVSRCRAVVVTHGLLLANRVSTSPSPAVRHGSEFGEPMDIKHAARNSLRSFAAVATGGIVWMNFHDQLPTVVPMILLAALTTILSTLPNPAAAVRGFPKGLIAAAAASFVLNFFVLPMANSYAMLMLAMLPVVFAAGLALSAPSRALNGPGRVTVILLSLLLHIENKPVPGSSIGMLPDFATWFQFVLGITGAITLTALAFRLFWPVSPRQRLREQMVGVFKELARGARHSREHFETRMYDRLNTLALSEIEQPYRFSARQAVQASINIGLEARSLVVLARRMSLPSELEQAIMNEINGLRHLVGTGRRSLAFDRAELQARSLHDLAEQVLAYALNREHEAERRLGIRAAVCAELTASALADYIMAYEQRASPLADNAPESA